MDLVRNFKKKNLIIMPHIGGSTKESIYVARLHIVQKIIKQIR